MSNARPIPAFVNPESGTAEGARDALSATGLFDIRETDPAKLEDGIREAVAGGATRVLVSGGDGTIRTGASAVAGTDTELAILPAGTLNHFARDHGIPVDLEEAARVATGPDVQNADAAFVGDKLFLNTSSIGAYVTFMRVRERFEKRFGYRVASFFALIRTFFYMRTTTIKLEIDGEERIYTSPIVFIGVGERETQMPTLGNRVSGGKRGLHIMIVHGRAKARLLMLAWEAVSRGVKSASRSPDFDSFIVDRCTITTRRSRAMVALDGEAELIDMPLEYRVEKDILRIVGGGDSPPQTDSGSKSG